MILVFLLCLYSSGKASHLSLHSTFFCRLHCLPFYPLISMLMVASCGGDSTAFGLEVSGSEFRYYHLTDVLPWVSHLSFPGDKKNDVTCANVKDHF